MLSSTVALRNHAGAVSRTRSSMSVEESEPGAHRPRARRLQKIVLELDGVLHRGQRGHCLEVEGVVLAETWIHVHAKNVASSSLTKSTPFCAFLAHVTTSGGQGRSNSSCAQRRPVMPQPVCTSSKTSGTS